MREGIHLQALRQHEVQAVLDHSRRVPLGGRWPDRIRRGVACGSICAWNSISAQLKCSSRTRSAAAKTLADVAERIVNVAFDVAGLVVVQQDGVRHSGRVRCVISGQFLDLELDQLERPLGRLGVDPRPPPPRARRDSARGRAPSHRRRPSQHAACQYVAGDDGDDAIGARASERRSRRRRNAIHRGDDEESASALVDSRAAEAVMLSAPSTISGTPGRFAGRA